MRALKPSSNSLLAKSRVAAVSSPLASRPRSRPLVVYATKAAGPTIRQPQFIEKLVKQSNIPEKQAKACIKAALDLITDEVSSGNRVSFTG